MIRFSGRNWVCIESFTINGYWLIFDEGLWDDSLLKLVLVSLFLFFAEFFPEREIYLEFMHFQPCEDRGFNRAIDFFGFFIKMFLFQDGTQFVAFLPCGSSPMAFIFFNWTEETRVFIFLCLLLKTSLIGVPIVLARKSRSVLFVSVAPADERLFNISKGIAICLFLFFYCVAGLSDHAVVTGVDSLLEVCSELADSGGFVIGNRGGGLGNESAGVLGGRYARSVVWFFMVVGAAVVDDATVEAFFDEFLERVTHQCFCLFLLDDERRWLWLCRVGVGGKGRDIPFRNFPSLHTY